MSEAPKIIQTPAQAIAVIHLEIERTPEAMGKAIGPALLELRAAVQAQGIDGGEPWFAHHHRITPEGFDFDVGIPVRTPVKASGRVKAAERPELTVARAVHRGNYTKLPDAWGNFQKWLESTGSKTAADVWETYVVGPDVSSDPADWRTQLEWPLRD